MLVAPLRSQIVLGVWLRLRCAGLDACWRFDSAAVSHKKVDGTLFSAAEINPGEGVGQPRKANFTIFSNFAVGGTPLPVLLGDVTCVYALVQFSSASSPRGSYELCALRARRGTLRTTVCALSVSLAGNVQFTLNTHDSAAGPGGVPTFPGFAHGRQVFRVDTAAANIVLGLPMVLYQGDLTKCEAKFPHLAGLPVAVHRAELGALIATGSVSSLDILASVAVETFDDGGTASGTFNLCEAGFTALTFGGARTIFSFP